MDTRGHLREVDSVNEYRLAEQIFPPICIHEAERRFLVRDVIHMSDNILEMRNITKTFSGVKALNGVNLKVRRGEIHGLCGENGAGKSTLMNILSGVYPAGTYTGEISYDGSPVYFRHIKHSEGKGIVIIHQELALVPYLSIAENIFLGNEIAKHGIINRDMMLTRTRDLMKKVNLRESPQTLVASLGTGKQQLTEIAKALSKKVNLLILDEPTASLTDEESSKLLSLLQEFRKTGITCVMISHKLNELTRIADSITVIRDGVTIETIDCKKEIVSEDRIIKSMVGRELTDRYPARESAVGETFFAVRNWTVFHPIIDERKMSDSICIELKRGEVIGIAGLMGAGRTEFAMSLFGRSYGRRISGEVFLNGKKVNVSTPTSGHKKWNRVRDRG